MISSHERTGCRSRGCGVRNRIKSLKAALYEVESLEIRRLLSGLGWSAEVNLPVARGDAAALTTNMGILLAGGTATTGASSTVYQLADMANNWTTALVLDQARTGLGIGETGLTGPTVANGDLKYTSDIFAFGGRAGKASTASVVSYAPTTAGEVVNAPAMSTPRAYFSYVTDTATGGLYAIGGLNGSGVPTVSAERYAPVEDGWSAIAPLPQALYGAAGSADGFGHLFVFGGATTNGGAPVSTVYRYTIATNSWDPVTSMPVALREDAAVHGPDGMFYVIGGLSASGAVSSVESYNPATDAWSLETPLPSAVYGVAATVDLNRSIEAIGGFNSSGAPVAGVSVSTPITTGVLTPYTPTVTVNSNTLFYAGVPLKVTASAVGIDGPTPVNGTISLTYNGSAMLPTTVGTYNVVAMFTSADSNYLNSVAVGSLTIIPTTPAITLKGGGTIMYDGQPHPVTATVVGVDNSTPVSGSIAYTYNGSNGAPVNAGTYNVVVTFTSTDPNYASATATTTIVIPDPTIPTGVKAVGVSTTTIKLTWNPVTVASSTYAIYQYHFLHNPRGSGGQVYYTRIGGGLTGTSYTFASAGGTFYVTSVNVATGAESARSAPAFAQVLSAPSLGFLLTSGGAVVSSDSVGQVLHDTLLAYGNPWPTFTMLSGPGGMSIDLVTGVITYAPAAREVGYVSATFQGTSPVGTTAPATFRFHVLALPKAAVTGGAFNFDARVHPATAVAYGTDGVTPIAGNFTFQYAPSIYPTSFSSSPYAESGTYLVKATFTSTDPGYGGATGSGTVVINAVAPTITINGGPFISDSSLHPARATATGVLGEPVNGTFTFTYDGLPTPPTAPGTYAVVANFHVVISPYVAWTDYTDTTATGTLSIKVPGASVVNRGVFYNNSYFDGNSPGANAAADSAAIAPDKTALLPGQVATFANYTSYDKGINGVMVDVANLPAVGVSEVDFTFTAGTSSTPGSWAAVPVPSSVTVFRGAGVVDLIASN